MDGNINFPALSLQYMYLVAYQTLSKNCGKLLPVTKNYVRRF